jgi:hypothetical protein
MNAAFSSDEVSSCAAVVTGARSVTVSTPQKTSEGRIQASRRDTHDADTRVVTTPISGAAPGVTRW